MSIRFASISRRSSIVAAALGIVLTTGTSAGAQGLTGAGSTFVNPIMQQWGAAYQKATGTSINYQSIGSGGGISALLSHTVDFAGSDAPMNAQELAEAHAPVLHLPVVIGTECVAYHVAGVSSGLRLTGPEVADIFLGKVQFWDDISLRRLNPRVRLPHDRIFVAHRSDGSGTTYIFTDYLSKISPEWKTRVGVGKSVHWPTGLGGKGNEGVSGLLETHQNSIGYIELAYALENKITYATMQNARGRYVLPGTTTGSRAAAGVRMPADMRVSITNTMDPMGYPITGFSWLIVYQQSPHAAMLKQFLHWVITTGQRFTVPLGYAPVPAVTQKRIIAMINTIR